VHCSLAYTTNDAPWTITLASGAQIEGGTVRGVPPELLDTPAAAAILDDSSAGPSVVLIDNTSIIDDMIDDMMPTPDPDESGSAAPGIPVTIPDDITSDPDMSGPSAAPASDAPPETETMSAPDGESMEQDAGGKRDGATEAGPGDERVAARGSDGASMASGDHGGCSLARAPRNVPWSFALLGLLGAGLGFRRRSGPRSVVSVHS
jgi:hypothetical protein